MSFEESLIRNASPTLASIKTANLYSFRFNSLEECLDTISRFNKMMNRKGIYIELVKNTGSFYLIYVYRKTHLLRAFEDEGIVNFLSEYGYSSEAGLQDKIDLLKTRLRGEKAFPHEIGVFLGYPLEDVKAFIEKKGNKCKLCGEWKVYHDEETARYLFCQYKHCRDMYIKEYKEGKRFGDMLVSA